MTLPPGSQPPRQKTLFDRIAYGFGSVAYGVKDNGFQVLLLLFYNQALGLSAARVGFAIMIALVCDALSDPVVGRVSDNLRTRWGRRHPFMYAAAFPVSISYYFLWNPPAGMSDDALFAYLLVLMVCIRTFITFYEIPSSALIVDLSEDYDERTSFLSFRYFFGWVGGLTMAVLAFSVFLRPGTGNPNGQLDLAGYANYGLTASLLMFVAIILSAAGTHRHIPTFPAPAERARTSWRDTTTEMSQILTFRPFLIVIGAAFFAYAATGLSGSILSYFRIYFWQLSGNQISLLLIGSFGGVVIGLWLAPYLSQRLGKKRAAVAFLLISVLCSPLAYGAHYLGIFPPAGSTGLVILLLAQAIVLTLCAMAAGVLISSMLADVVEDFAVYAGHRPAGVFFAASAFTQKVVSGVGIFLSGLILQLAAFPQGAQAGEVGDATLLRMVLTEVPMLMVLQLAALALILLYPITRAQHRRNIEESRRIRVGRANDR